MNCSAKSAGVGRVENLNVVVVGASGDLARKKIFPALASADAMIQSLLIGSQSDGKA